MPSRPYELKRRAASMEERRGRIVAAAREELISGGRFTLEAVAERAKVSRVTLYAQFGDRDALLEAVYDDLAASGGFSASQMPSQRRIPSTVSRCSRLCSATS